MQETAENIQAELHRLRAKLATVQGCLLDFEHTRACQNLGELWSHHDEAKAAGDHQRRGVALWRILNLRADTRALNDWASFARRERRNVSVATIFAEASVDLDDFVLTNRHGFTSLMAIRRAQGRLVEARDLGRALYDEFPGDVYVLRTLGHVEYDLGHFGEAERLLRRAEEMEPSPRSRGDLKRCSRAIASRIWRTKRGALRRICTRHHAAPSPTPQVTALGE